MHLLAQELPPADARRRTLVIRSPRSVVRGCRRERDLRPQRPCAQRRMGDVLQASSATDLLQGLDPVATAVLLPGVSSERSRSSIPSSRASERPQPEQLLDVRTLRRADEVLRRGPAPLRRDEPRRVGSHRVRGDRAVISLSGRCAMTKSTPEMYRHMSSSRLRELLEYMPQRRHEEAHGPLSFRVCKERACRRAAKVVDQKLHDAGKCSCRMCPASTKARTSDD